MPNPDRLICVGKFGAPHGVHGWLKIISHTQARAGILDYSPWHIQQRGSWHEISLADVSAQDDHLLVRPQHCEDRDFAQSFTNLEIFIKRSQLPPITDGDYYWSDLEGLTVTNIAGSVLGKVDHLFETGANPVMVVIGEKRHLLPFLKDSVIKQVSFETNTIVVDWPEDL
jgi:16S rRNA processing protein RimM